MWNHGRRPNSAALFAVEERADANDSKLIGLLWENLKGWL
jgi:hypothetical protein